MGNVDAGVEGTDADDKADEIDVEAALDDLSDASRP